MAGDHLCEAHQAAAALDEGIYRGTAFGPGSVRIHQVTLLLDLNDPGAALAHAAGWAPPESLPSERRSHLYIDLARAHLSLDRPDSALNALHIARDIAPEHVRPHHQVRTIAEDLMRSARSSASAAADFASWVGIPQGGVTT
jgi:hypothetical protein